MIVSQSEQMSVATVDSRRTVDMVGRIRKWVRKLGYDISPFPGAATHWGRIVETLESHDVDCLLDIGANTGQYARAIRANGSMFRANPI